MTLRNTIRPFDLTHGGRDVSPDEIKATFTTTTREAMKEGVGIGVAAAIAEEKGLKTFLRGPHAPPAGGPGSIPEGRGKRTSGVTGEILNLSDDARVNTLAQRSWMYAPDAALTAILNVSNGCNGLMLLSHDCDYDYSLPICSSSTSPLLPFPNHSNSCPLHLLLQPKKEPSPHETTSLPGLEGGEASHIYSCITKAPLGSTHGMHSAFQAAPRIRTDVTLTRDRIGGTRAARGKVFMDDP